MSRPHPSSSPPPDLRRTEAYDYTLPPGRIARYPSERRDGSRLLVVPRGALEGDGLGSPSSSDPFQDLSFSDLPSLVREGDVLVVNESRVLPVRLLGRKPTGAECEVLLLRPVERGADPSEAARWEALVRPGSKLKPGRRVVVSPELEVVVEAGLPNGLRVVRLESAVPLRDALERNGRIPLPPYLEREDEPADRERYQTVYARTPGSVAAPTAGLHFTPELLECIDAHGARIAKVTLHVGPGTFRPVTSETIEEHRMDGERWHVPADAAVAIAKARQRGGRVWAVGTTVARTLESAADETGKVRDGEGETDLFIFPGYPFKVVDALITNFHLPRSTLLMLVAAFAGYRTTLAAYARAVASGYRFYSYGDAMVVTPRSGERP
ncbi:MAG: tRNA preQ1(34) S-adenosylmethionine ribosyltransferase-isomerase QueA [Gemmatimonadetes bacterium]|nr:tRNA preQ1(34) S-adenosylmethionine ribosyltransferase-isomerase QueA [Gemmatimonadota bacterium]